MRKELLLLFAGIGLFILSLISTQPAEEVNINSLEASNIGAKVAVTGNISTTYSTDEAVFMEIKDETGKIKGVSFNELPEFSGRSRVTGRVDLYQGELQLIVDEAGPKFQRPVRN